MAFGFTAARHKRLMMMAYEDARHYLTASEGHLNGGNCRAALMALRHANRAFARGRAHDASKLGAGMSRSERARYDKSLPEHLNEDLEFVEEQLHSSGCLAEKLGVRFR